MAAKQLIMTKMRPKCKQCIYFHLAPHSQAGCFSRWADTFMLNVIAKSKLLFKLQKQIVRVIFDIGGKQSVLKHHLYILFGFQSLIVSFFAFVFIVLGTLG